MDDDEEGDDQEEVGAEAEELAVDDSGDQAGATDTKEGDDQVEVSAEVEQPVDDHCEATEEGDNRVEVGAEAEQPVDGTSDQAHVTDIKEGDVGSDAQEAVGAKAETEPAGTDGGGEESDESSSESSDDGDDASVVDEKDIDEEPANPLDILVFSLPTPQPEVVEKPAQANADEEEYNEDNDETAVSPFISTSHVRIVIYTCFQGPKKRKQTKLERRVAAIETKLDNIEKFLKDAKLDGIEKLLQEVLSATKGMAQP